MQTTQEVNILVTPSTTLLDHLIVADYALTQLGHALSEPGLLTRMHPQDLREWLDQLQDRFDTITN